MSAPTLPASATGVRAFAVASAERLAELDEDGAVTAVGLLASALVAWNATLLFADPALTGLAFLLGPFLGIGVLVTVLAVDPDSTGTATGAFLSLVNGVLAVTAVAAVARYTPLLPFTRTGVVAGFDAAYAALCGTLWVGYRDRIERASLPDVRWGDVAFAALCLAGVGLAALAFRVKAATGDRLAPVLAFLWVLATFVAVFVRRPTDRRRHALFLAAAGVVMTWSHALSSNGLMAVDGLSTVRLVRATVFDVEMPAFSPRLAQNLTISSLLPGLSYLSTWTPFRVAKYVIPAVAGLSLVGIYRVTREWIDAQAAFAATFLICFQWPFMVSLTTSYRTAFAVPALVACVLALRVADTRWGFALALAYFTGTVALHDTVGVFLLGALGVAGAVALATRVPVSDRSALPLPLPPGLRSREVLSLVALPAGGVFCFYLLYSRGETLTQFLLKGVVLAVALLTGIPLQGGTRRTVGTTVGTLGETVVELLQRAAIVSEIGIMGLGTALLLAGWLFGDRLTGRLPWHDGDRALEVLVVGTAAWFGLMVVQPLLGVTRVYLYGAPLLLGLFAFVVRQLDAVPGLLRGRSGRYDRPSARTLSSVVLLGFVVVAFFVQSGLAGYAVGGSVSQKPFGDTDQARFKHYSPQDVAGNDWVVEHPPDGETLTIGAQTFPLFDDDPQVPYANLRRLQDGDRLTTALARGCLFVQTVNYRTGEFVVRIGDRGVTTPREYPVGVLDRHDLVYTAGSTRVYC